MASVKNYEVLQKILTDTLKQREKVLVYLFRHGQSIGNYAGSIVGWTDSKLSVRGREDANKLYKGLHKNIGNFTKFHCSDLSRCKDTLSIATGFADIKPAYTANLRELNFGDQQGVHYDSLPEQQKKIISSLQYEPPNGETWPQARKRAMEHISTLQKGNHFLMTHGGLICALTYHLGITKVIPNCSMVCAEYCPDKKDLVQLVAKWECER